MHTQKVVSLHPVLALILGLDQNDTPKTTSSAPLSNDRPDPNESASLAYGSVENLENYCQRVISGTASIKVLIYALPSLIKSMKRRPQCERNSAKDSLKQVLFHANISDEERERVYNAVCTICHM